MNTKSISDKQFDIINTLLVTIITLMIVYPLIYVLSASISDPVAVNSGEVWLLPKGITFEGYKRVLNNNAIWVGYRNTIIYTILGTIIHLVMLIPAAYALSRKEIRARKPLMWFILFTMFFSGGLIPTYMVIDSLGMTNTIWAVTIPGALSAWSILVAKSFFDNNIPNELIESAKIDGASEFNILFSIVLPLAKPIIFVMALFRAVGIWNEYFSALIYLRDESLFPLQLILRQILILNQTAAESIQTSGISADFIQQINNASLVKYAVIIVSALPLLIIYPFIQKYFTTGTLVGSVKE